MFDFLVQGKYNFMEDVKKLLCTMRRIPMNLFGQEIGRADRVLPIPGNKFVSFRTKSKYLTSMRTRLTPFAKLLIVVVVVGLGFLGYRALVSSGKLGLVTDSGPVTTEVAEQKTDAPAEGNTKAPSNSRQAFNYTPKAPVNGVLKGVVELGAAGFNSFVVEIDQQKNWKLQKAEWGNSLVYDGMASGKDVTQTLKQYIGGMLDFGVTGKNIHFVVSSGATKVESTQKIIKGIRSLGYVVNTVTPEQEAKLALKCVLPPSYEGQSFVVDIGSGNTKVSWIEGGQPKGIETYGAKYYVDNTPDNEVYLDVRSKAVQVPESKRKTCFIIGGVPFTLAKEVRQGEERYTVLKAPGDYQPEGAKEKCGLNIYNAIVDATGCQQFVFDWEANFTIGFLLTL